MLLNQLRQSFIEFFGENGHYIASSSPLIPYEDPSLMFVNSGMVQFKNFFTNQSTPPSRRIASAQKCVRAGGKHNDLDNVGYTARHHTFFEMLGNFSFGDYFKEEAISFAWNFLTKTLNIPQNKLYVTVYHTDDEAISLWEKIAGLSDSRIIKISTDDNFWKMGDTGPCGPCSEIFYDHGDNIFGGLPGTPDQDGDRYVEIWNLVFTQYDLQKDGSKLILPQKCIDTGSGLERLAAVMQGKTSNYDTDIFQKIIAEIKGLTNSPENVAHRVIADHLRSASFLIADGVMPSNEGRGYVLRRIMRRAMRYVHQLSYKSVLMYKLVPLLVAEMGGAYPELKLAEASIVSVLESEEDKFRETLARGMKLLDESTETLSAGEILPGEVAFKLYDTYGFPLDLTTDVLRSRHITVNKDEFDQAMKRQQQLAKASWVGSGERAADDVWLGLFDQLGTTEFLGYKTEQATCEVKAIVQGGKTVNEASEGKVWVVLQQTPFYAESGGQVGDTGHIAKHKVLDVKKEAGGLFCHLVELSGFIKVHEYVEALVDSENRRLIRANHSAAHLLQEALRKVLGTHVNQKGSMVNSEKVRFDFSHQKALTPDEINQVEQVVNSMIINNHESIIKLTSPKKAIESGAIALFGEKYGEEVRVIKMGDSIELCGGTHVSYTGDIGLFKIISEEAIASGIRRIEGLTGVKALEFLNSKQKLLSACLGLLKCREDELTGKIESTQNERKQLEKENTNLRIRLILSVTPTHEIISGDKFVKLNLQDFAAADLKLMANSAIMQYEAKIILIALQQSNKTSVFIQVAKEALHKYSAANILKKLPISWELKGGGNAEVAQAGSNQLLNLDGVNLLDLV
jgi:alanyl-tRNA synthetase